MKEEIVDIFRNTLHKLTLKSVKLIGTSKTKAGRTYYVFEGKFDFIPPEYLFDDDKYNELIDNKEEILKEMKSFEEESSNCFRHRFTKKIIVKKEVEKYTFDYVFDVVPKNIIDYSFDIKKRKMTFIVKGEGI